MQRRNFLLQSSMALGAISLSGRQLLAAVAPQDPWKMRMLRNDVGIFYEKGGTIGYLLSPEGIIVIDSEFPEQAKHLIAEIRKQSGEHFELLINTHHHGDHTGGNIAFKGIAKNVLAHSNSAANQKRVAVARKNEDQQLYPNVTFDSMNEFTHGKEKLKLTYLGAAHTNGDIIVHFQHANIAHMGDLMFNRMYAFIDNSAGASTSNWMTVLDGALKQFDDDTIFIFGHAADPDKVTGNKDDLRAMKDYLGRLHDFVSGWIKAGKTKEDLLKETSIPGLNDWHGDGIKWGLEATYDQLTAAKG
jgi:cyclase